MDFDQRNHWQKHIDALRVSLKYDRKLGISSKESMEWALNELLEMRETLCGVRNILGEPKPDEPQAITRVREIVTWQLRNKL